MPVVAILHPYRVPTSAPLRLRSPTERAVGGSSTVESEPPGWTVAGRNVRELPDASKRFRLEISNWLRSGDQIGISNSSATAVVKATATNGLSNNRDFGISPLIRCESGRPRLSSPPRQLECGATVYFSQGGSNG